MLCAVCRGILLTWNTVGRGKHVCCVQVYSVALYVEAEKAAKELGIRYRGGFFESDADYCQAILDGAFSKVFKVRGVVPWPVSALPGQIVQVEDMVFSASTHHIIPPPTPTCALPVCLP